MGVHAADMTCCGGMLRRRRQAEEKRQAAEAKRAAIEQLQHLMASLEEACGWAGCPSLSFCTLLTQDPCMPSPQC